ncbi:MAG: HEAT repeat domain-containing protein, partial [Planctomycetes bacterium]|nr:HEAT repeat domain-containing protein [Planctomycetota bacterium]
PYGFKPTDLVVDYDGSLLISDWCDGQRPKRGRGRIYRITHTSAKKPERNGTLDISEASVDLVRLLDSPSYHTRVAVQLMLSEFGEKVIQIAEAAWKANRLGPAAKMHVAWLIAQSGQKEPSQKAALETLLVLAESETDAAAVKRQLIRAIGDLVDPVLVEGKLNAGRGDVEIAERIAKLGENADPRVLLEVLTVLRRLRWCDTPEWIAEHLVGDDPALNHAAQQALRNADNWIGVVKLLDESPRLRRLALQAMAEQRVAYLATQLIERLQEDVDPQRRIEASDALSRIVRKLPEWEYWGFRPALRKPATVSWEKTDAIVAALNKSLADQEFDVRAASLKRMRREGVAVEFGRLSSWLPHESDPHRASAILDALADHDADKVRQLLVGVIQDGGVPEAARLQAFSTLAGKLPADQSALIRLLGMSVENRVLAAVIAELGERRDPLAEPLILIHALSPLPAVRAASIRALGQLGSEKARELIRPALDDSNAEVQLAAAEAAGPVAAQDAIAPLYKLAGRKDRRFVAACLTSLRMLKFELAVPIAVDALEHPETQLPALRYLREFGGTKEAEAVAEVALTNHAAELQREVIETLVEWQRRKPADRVAIPKAIGTIHGRSGRPLVWGVARGDDSPPETVFADGASVEVALPGATEGEETRWQASTLVRVPTRREVEFLCSSTGRLIVRLDGVTIYSRSKPGGYRTDSDRFQAMLTPDASKLSVEVTSPDAKPRFHLRFRPISSKVDHERLTKLALRSRGSAGRGRDSFMNKDNAGCIKCHPLSGEGGKIGPDLTGIGRRFSRIHLIESILEPSRTVAPSYATLSLVLENGRILSGIKVEEKKTTLVIGDKQGKLNEVAKSQIEELIKQPTSTMPEGLEKKMTDREFLDLIAFLELQKATPPKRTLK